MYWNDASKIELTPFVFRMELSYSGSDASNYRISSTMYIIFTVLLNRFLLFLEKQCIHEYFNNILFQTKAIYF